MCDEPGVGLFCPANAASVDPRAFAEGFAGEGQAGKRRNHIPLVGAREVAGELVERRGAPPSEVRQEKNVQT